MEFEALRQNERREKEKFSYNSLIPKGDKETEDWYDYKKLPEEIPQFPYFRRMLLGADSVVHTPRLRTFETNVSKMAKISDLMSKTWKIRGRMGQVGPGANYHARQGRLSYKSNEYETRTGNNWEAADQNCYSSFRLCGNCDKT